MPEYNTALGVLPSPKTQLFGGNAGSAAQESPLAQQAQPRQQPQGGAQTFAQMQQQGQARPAPQAFSFTANIAPPPSGAGVLGQQFQQGQASQQLLQQLMGRLGQMQTAASVYDDPAFAQRRQAAMANLQAERAASESKLQDEMAARGLAASSIAAGRMGDIAGQFARAQGTLEADLLKEAMAQEQQRQQFLTQQLGQTLGTVGGQELQAFQANVQSAQAERDIALRTAQLQLEAEKAGVELSLTQARDLATQEYQKGQLAQAAADMASRERLQAQQLQFQAGESAMERALRLQLQSEQQAFQRGESKLERDLRLAMQGSEQTFQAAQSAKERELREAMQTRELTAAEKRQLAQIEADKASQERQFGFQRSESALDRNQREAARMSETTGIQYTVINGQVVPMLDKDGNTIKTSAVSQAEAERTARAAEAEKDRALRERLGLTESTGILYGPDGKPVLDASGQPVRTIAGQQLDLSKAQAGQATLLQLANILASMSANDRETFINSLPPDLQRLLGRTSVAPAAGGGGGDVGGGYGGYGPGVGGRE